MGYHRAGFDVTGVDIKAQPRYPFEFRQADAMAYPLDGFDAIHASPPCQGYLNLRRVNDALGRANRHGRLISSVRARLMGAGVPYVIENVQDARQAMRAPVRMCGTSLWLPLRRHRLFECNFPVKQSACRHERFTEARYWTGWRPNGERRLSTVVQVYGNAGGREHWPAAMGIDWMTSSEMTEAIPPAYTEFIGAQLLAHLRQVVA